MTFSEISAALLSHLPHRMADWSKRDTEFGEYIDAGELTCYLLDEFVRESQVAPILGQELERLYDAADEGTKEVMRIGMFEEMCVVLHNHWDERGHYDEARSSVLRYLGPHAKEVFVRYEAEAHNRA